MPNKTEMLSKFIENAAKYERISMDIDIENFS